MESPEDRLMKMLVDIGVEWVLNGIPEEKNVPDKTPVERKKKVIKLSNHKRVGPNPRATLNKKVS